MSSYQQLNVAPNPVGAYGNFTMNTTQTAASLLTPIRVAIDTTSVAVGGLTLASNRITVANGGTYECSWRGYATRVSGTSPQDWLWARINNVDVPNSMTTVATNSNITDGVMVKTTLLTFNPGDVLDFWWSTDNAGSPLTYVAALTSPYARPSQVAFGVTMNLVG
jgi:hypothetical protein